MKSYPQAVVDMLERGDMNHAYGLTIYFDTPVRFTNASHDILKDGYTYVSSSEINGIGELSRNSNLTVTELNINLDLANSATANAVYLSDIYGVRVEVKRFFIDGDDVIYSEVVWQGYVSSFADSDDEHLLTLNVSNFWGDFSSSNPWRTTPNSQQRRHPSDECFKFAAKAEEIIYWGENPTNSGD